MTDDNRCPVTAPEGGARCTLPTGHRPPHRGGGRMWLDEGSRCPAQRTPEGDQCVRPVRHPLPHRDAGRRTWPLPFDGKDEPRRCAMFSHAADQGRCIFDAGHEHPHRDERDTEWQKQRWHYDDTAASKGLLGRLRDLNDSLDKVCELVSRAQDVCGATHTPEDVTYVCSRRSGHAGGHLDDAQDEWWALPVRDRERAEPSANPCGERLKDYGFLCREPEDHDGPHVDRFFGMSWGVVRLEKLPALCGFPCFFFEGHEGECSHRY